MRSSSLLLTLPALLLLAHAGRAGCLAPSDTAVDVAAGAGPHWGNETGSMVYQRQGVSGHPTLVLRDAAGSAEEVAVEGDSNEFYVGLEHERWVFFHTAMVNAAGDLAFVASSKLPDDTTTPANEAAPRRGVYARSGRTLHRVARFGEPSPIRDALDEPVKWGTLFDAVVSDADPSGFLGVVFSGQVAGETDQRLGLFRWSEASPANVVPAVLTGDVAPSGGTFFSFGRLRGTGAGEALFFGVTTLTESSPQIPGLFLLRADGTSARVVKFGTDGDAAPGGGRFAIAGDFDVDAAGVVSFGATLDAAPTPTGLFRARPPLYVPEKILAEGEPTPIGGFFGSFARAIVRTNAGGELVFAADLSEDLGGQGLFTVPVGSSVPAGLVSAEEIGSVAAIGAARASYGTPTAVRVVVPADGSEQGPVDFRVVNLDLRNSVPLRSDTLKMEGRFQLPAWDTVPPATFRGDAERFTPTARLAGASLTEIDEVKLSLSSGPGNNFIFGIASPASAGTMKFNGQTQMLKSVAISPDGGTATWKFSGSPGPGTFTVDLLHGTFSLSVSKATLQPSYQALNFRVAFVLRTADDVAQARADADSWFRRDIRVDGRQPGFGGGLRVTSQGESVDGGTVFVDSLRVTRKAAKGARPASDSLQLAGTLRLCPGSSAPVTPQLAATVRVGDFVLDGVEMTRKGQTAVYRYVADGVDLVVDIPKGLFTLKVKSLPPLAALASATPGSATNGPERTVGGMQLDFTLSVPRVYEVSFPVPVRRLPKGTVFEK